MHIFRLVCSVLVSLLFASSLAAAQGPRGGPSFDHYEWTEMLATDLGDNASIEPPPFPPFWPGVDHWEPRAGLEAVELHNLLFVIGGRTPIPNAGFASIIHGDVWVSDDLGRSWDPVLADPFDVLLWPNRAYHEVVTLGSRMYLLGGQNFDSAPIPGPCTDFSVFFNDVWRSADGFQWEQLRDNTDNSDPGHWQARAGLSAVSFRGKLWVMGGSQGDDASIGGCGRTVFNDVWYSEDGIEWHEATADIDKSDPEAIWRPRAGAAALVKGGWLYILGGEKAFLPSPADPFPYFNDVWRTQDGAHWERVTGDSGAAWSPRPGHGCAVAANHFVCFGGYDPAGNPSDVWVSKDGAAWTRVSESPWNNNPDAGCVADPPAETCDNIRYDFDTLSVTGGKGGMKTSIYTFGGDRELFPVPPLGIFPPPDNWKRVENDVWRFAPPQR
jgi:hypothetical protein